MTAVTALPSTGPDIVAGINQLVDLAIVAQLLEPDSDFAELIGPSTSASLAERAAYLALVQASLDELQHGDFLVRRVRIRNIHEAVMRRSDRNIYANPCLRKGECIAFTCTQSDGIVYVMEFSLNEGHVVLGHPLIKRAKLKAPNPRLGTRY